VNESAPFFDLARSFVSMGLRASIFACRAAQYRTRLHGACAPQTLRSAQGRRQPDGAGGLAAYCPALRDRSRGQIDEHRGTQATASGKKPTRTDSPARQADRNPRAYRQRLRQSAGLCHQTLAALIRYADSGHLSIENNPVENSIRPIAIGKKNWLFSGSEQGNQRAAAIQT
jgi:hypothetical protein